MSLKNVLSFDGLEYVEVYERNGITDFYFGVYKIFYLPTEVVIREPQIAVPVEGRVYKVGLFLKNGSIMTYEEISKLDGFNGTYWEQELMLVEIYLNGGEDGHTRYVLEGYALMTFPQLNKYLAMNEFKVAKDFWEFYAT